VAGIPKSVRLHDVRHTTASIVLGERPPVTAVCERLGHRSSAITLAVYSHALPGQQARAADVLERAIWRTS
jgi:integrase